MSNADAISLYLHVPYCRALCHYCDFAKTANFDDKHTRAYFHQLLQHFVAWNEWLGQPTYRSVFLGGGTPSLFTDEWVPLMSALRDHLAPGAEVTLEANPDDITPERLKVWRGMGINRLSMGIQTFDPKGLARMKRTHSVDNALSAVKLAKDVFPQVNFDLIFGWPGQTREGWQSDLDQAVALSPQHLSLYVLTYESGTPMGRAYERGKLEAVSDEGLSQWYDDARQTLVANGYEHGEVSNFAKPGCLSVHNSHYWQHGYYLGIGSGAHSFLPFGEWGERFAYDRSDRRFLKDALVVKPIWRETLRGFGLIERERSREAWLTELVLTGLRTKQGIDLERAEKVARATLHPCDQIKQALDSGLLTIAEERYLRLASDEWFREGAWARVLSDALY